jgi:hypothetical protein
MAGDTSEALGKGWKKVAPGDGGRAYYFHRQTNTTQYDAGMLTQGGQGSRPAPLAWRFLRVPTHFPLNLHAIWWKLPAVGPPG